MHFASRLHDLAESLMSALDSHVESDDTEAAINFMIDAMAAERFVIPSVVLRAFDPSTDGSSRLPPALPLLPSILFEAPCRVAERAGGLDWELDGSTSANGRAFLLCENPRRWPDVNLTLALWSEDGMVQPDGQRLAGIVTVLPHQKGLAGPMDFFRWAMAVILRSGTVSETVPEPVALNRARLKCGKPPIMSHTVLSLTRDGLRAAANV
ncbi:hypothetical protein [Azospirillum sp. TSO5]|uniref:hypothetical protein n=1 Tax=Azospirillum sp. TSO5 TaxID=716760 RepID=UPI000D6084E8|nr:hypothetical protein [Azospirillum sp. TSO5]PWC92996.1 hypothetical protein TSO5_16365 [Azospirillum sp. TSO5]